MAEKPFDIGYVIANGDNYVIINGEQATRIGLERVGDNWRVTFYLSDGTSHVIDPNTWTKKFATELILTFKPVPKE